MKRLVRFRQGIVVCLLACSAAHAVAAADVADFASGRIPAGWTVQNGEYRSPEYSNAVDRIELRYSGADAAASATVRAFPMQQGDGTTVATLTAASSGAAFDFPEATDFRSFRIAAESGLALYSFAAHVSPGSLETPSGVTVSNNTTGTSFDSCWNAVDGATGYRVYVWTNAVAGASAGTAVWQETMPGVTNGANNTMLDDAKFAACFANPGWTRSGKAGYSTDDEGVIRIGTTSDGGWIQSPAIDAAADGMAVRFCAKAGNEKSNGKSIVVERVSGETAIFAGTAMLSLEMQEFFVPLSDWERGDCIRFNSITNGDRRVIVGAVTVVSGYSEGRLEPSYLEQLDVGPATAHPFAALPSVPVQFAVEAYGRRGVTSARTEAVEVDLANPDKVAVLNACPLSSLADKTYAQDFDSLSGADTDWLNGTTLAYWQAYKGDAAVTKITHNTGTGSSGGLYALATDTKSYARALGGMTTKTDMLTWGIAFTNDTDRSMSLSSVAYSAQQWGTRNSEAHRMVLEYRLADSIRWLIDETGDWTECCWTEADGSNPAVPVLSNVLWNPDNPVVIAPGQILCLRWKVKPPASGGAAMMGIDDLRVAFESVSARGFSIRLAASLSALP